MTLPNVDLSEVLVAQEGVLSTSTALRYMSEDQLRWKLSSGRWQKLSRGVVITPSGPPTEPQLLRARLVRARPRSAAGQQGWGRPAERRLGAERIEARRRRKLIAEALGDIAGGSQAMSELDFIRLVVRGFGFPEPSRQSARRDRRGRRRWID